MVFVRALTQGDYFGELALLTDSTRQASIKSINYCTLAGINQKSFKKMYNRYSEVYVSFKQAALDYRDPWKQFRIKLLEQVDYLNPKINRQEFLNEVHYYMREEYYDQGEIILRP